MKILQIHNATTHRGGGEFEVELISKILNDHGHDVILMERSNKDLSKNLIKKADAFINGSYSLSEYRRMLGIIKLNRPDIVHAHGLYPFFTPSVLVACRKMEIPVVLHCHSFQLICPIALLFRNNDICDLCSNNKEYWCILKNCRNNIFESVGYALRHYIAKRFHLFHKNVDFFIVPSEFSRQRHILAGYQKRQILVLPNTVAIPDKTADVFEGHYVAFVGRLSPEKGVDTLLLAAEKLPEVQFHIAGNGPLLSRLTKQSPKNTAFLGFLKKSELAELYYKAKFVVMPSLCFETFCLVAAEAMSYGLPVIASRRGGLQELVVDGLNGLLFEPGNAEELAEKIKLLWENPDLCRQMGETGREKVIREYSEDVYYERLMAIYKNAISRGISN